MQGEGVRQMTGENSGSIGFPTWVALAAALAMMAIVVGEVLGTALPSQTAIGRGMWAVFAVALGIGAILASRKPQLWGAVAGLAAVAGATLAFNTATQLRYDGTRVDVGLFGSVLVGGLCVATAVLGMQFRWARSPLTITHLSTALVASGIVSSITIMIPPAGSRFSFMQWNILSGPGVDTLAWLGAVSVLGGCLIAAGRWRSAFGRWLAAGALAPVVLSALVAQAVDEGATLYWWDGQQAHTLFMLAILGAAGVVVAAHLTATEVVADVLPVRGSVTAVAVPATQLSGLALGPSTPTAYAAVGARFGAMVIDGLIGTAFTLPGYSMVFGAAAAGSDGGAGAGMIVLLGSSIIYPIIYTRRVGTRGQSWGHQACGVRVVDAVTGGPIGGGRAFGRVIMRGLAAIPCYLGLLWALWEPRRRGWHDMACNTVVVPAHRPFAAVGTSSGGASFAPAHLAPAPLLTPPPPPPPPPGPPAPAMSAPSIGADFASALGREPAPAAVVLERLVVLFDNGRREVLNGTLIIGRDPAPSAVDPGAALISIDDPTMSVSKTHMAIGLDGDKPWVEDRNSTNGVLLITRGETVKIVAGKRVRIGVGASVRFGDRSVSVVAG